MEYVQLVNRTEQTLQGTWNGRHYDIAPGKHEFTRLQAEAFQRQNPVMGTENPITGNIVYKIGIKENGDDCTPLKDMKESVEKWDRTKLPGAKPVEIVDGDNGLYSLKRDRTAGSGGVQVGGEIGAK